ncbi:MAG TPA: hypothetical protein VIJ79_06695 [Acidobacteriaceae bacterium]
MILTIMLFTVLFVPQEAPQKPDATAMEAQYKTCAKHYIPTEKCTPEVYQQLKEKDAAPLDADTAFALGAVNEYRPLLKNPGSMQIRAAYIFLNKCKKCEPDDKTVCLEVSAQNGFGGMTTNHIARITMRGKTRWEYESDTTGPFVMHFDPWDSGCKYVTGRIDVTEKVNQALKNAQ